MVAVGSEVSVCVAVGGRGGTQITTPAINPSVQFAAINSSGVVPYF